MKGNGPDNKKQTGSGTADKPDAARARRRPLRLPFDDRRQDSVLWIYDHRIGLAVLVAAYIALGIAFLSTEITLNKGSRIQGFEIDLQALDELERERDRLEALTRLKQQSDIDWSAIKNTSSNENALNENLKDDRGTNASALNESAEETEKRMRANREAYERGMAEVDAIGKDRGKSDSDRKNNDRKVKGSVTVSFSFTNPIRYSRHLIKPAYRCEGGGEVVVSATLDCTGKVVSAQVRSGGDECMRRTALEAARNSTFDINEKAPARQSGTITYIFIPQ